jgi:hypothetical protein
MNRGHPPGPTSKHSSTSEQAKQDHVPASRGTPASVIVVFAVMTADALLSPNESTWRRGSRRPTRYQPGKVRNRSESPTTAKLCKAEHHAVPHGVEGEAGRPVTAVSLPARGRPPRAAARRAGLEGVEKSLPATRWSVMAERDAGIACSLSSCVPVGARTEPPPDRRCTRPCAGQANLPAQRSAAQAGDVRYRRSASRVRTQRARRRRPR